MTEIQIMNRTSKARRALIVALKNYTETFVSNTTEMYSNITVTVYQNHMVTQLAYQNGNMIVPVSTSIDSLQIATIHQISG